MSFAEKKIVVLCANALGVGVYAVHIEVQVGLGFESSPTHRGPVLRFSSIDTMGPVASIISIHPSVYIITRVRTGTAVPNISISEAYILFLGGSFDTIVFLTTSIV
jgi:hypothetical protein